MKRTRQPIAAVLSTLMALGASLALATPAQAATEEPVSPPVVTLDRDATEALATGGTSTPITSPPPGAGRGTTSVAPTWSEKRKWYGKQFRFTERETRNIAAGGGICTSFITKVPGLGVACAAASSAANLALANDKCLAYNTYYGGSSNPWFWNCRGVR